MCHNALMEQDQKDKNVKQECIMSHSEINTMWIVLTDFERHVHETEYSY